MEITANELRIGNALIVGGIDRIVYVSAIFNTHFRCRDADGIEFEESIRCNYKPIPLTEEILLKCGFVKTNDKLLFLPIPMLGLEIHAAYFRNTWLIELNNHVKPIVTEVYNLHQLQNLYFALTGQELNVKL